MIIIQCLHLISVSILYIGFRDSQSPLHNVGEKSMPILDLAYEVQLKKNLTAGPSERNLQRPPARMSTSGTFSVVSSATETRASDFDTSNLSAPQSPSRSTTELEDDSGRVPQLDDIKTEYHPSSKHPTEICRFDEYGHQNTTSFALPQVREDPWQPFRTRLDYEFGEIAQEAALNQKQTDALIRLFHKCASGQDSFTLSNHAELQKTWELAKHKMTPFEKTSFTVPYKNTEQEFDHLISHGMLRGSSNTMAQIL
ncbi:hypothetical protein A0H81_05715 [Grifola frondosa]|uniref:Uncharacterized protein n=1 Tax=Grifola frondosa TaxID=5627 RepID=A0A1C7MBK7_GRIFR|nr:hypothetical protein A0H81_05715 [Grifola frondosa]